MEAGKDDPQWPAAVHALPKVAFAFAQTSRRQAAAGSDIN